MIRYIKKLSIRTQLYFVTAMIVVSMIVILFISNYQLTHVIEDKNRAYYDQLISQINQNIMDNTDSINRMIKNIAYNKSIIQDYIEAKNPSDQYQKYEKVKYYLSEMMELKDGIIDIAVIGKNGANINLNGAIDQLLPISQEFPENTLFYYSGIKDLVYQSGTTQHKKVFIAGARIYSLTDFSRENREIGFLMITLDPKAIMSSKNAMGGFDKSQFYMLDRERSVFLTSDSSLKVGDHYLENSAQTSNKSQTIQEDEYIIQSGEIPDLGGTIIYKIYKGDLLKGIDAIRKQQVLLFSGTIVLLLIPYSFVINNILAPLKKLMRFMKEIKSGQLKTLKKRVEVQGYAEIIVMTNEFNSMLDEINELTHRLFETTTNLYETELAKQQTEMAYLKSQINPHFLYNTLESIKGIAVEEGVDRIFYMSNALAQIFRYCIKGSDLVTLEAEMKIIVQYLYIQKIRFGDRLEITYALSEESQKSILPKMILQPIIENAIYHGIEPMLGTGHLFIKSEIYDNNLLIIIQDDGVGIEEELLVEVNSGLKTKQDLKMRFQDNGNDSIGLFNVNNQIKLLYGNEYGIALHSQLGQGTQIQIKIPFRSENHV